MLITETLNEGLKREFAVTVGASDLRVRLDAELKTVASQIRLPGFRPGKAPASLIRKMHGKAVMGQILENALREGVQKTIESKNLRPVSQPSVDIKTIVEDIDDEKDFAFTLAFEILPEIEIPDLSALSFTRLAAAVEDDQVETALKELAAGQKSFEDAGAKAKAANGDVVTIDFLGKIDGVAFPGGAGENFDLELGSGMFIPGFEEQLVGVKTGDEKDVNVNFPETYHARDLAGKPAVFEVKVRAVKKPVETKIDQDLAKRFGFENLDALKGSLKTRIENEHKAMARLRLKRELLDALADLCSFDIPASMAEMEFRQIWEQIKRDAIMSGQASAADFEGKTGPDDAKERADYEAIAARRVRLGLLLSEVGQKNAIQVRQDEVNRAIAEEARRFPGQERQVFDYFMKNEGALAQLRAPIFEDKVVDFILGVANVAEKSVTRAELDAAIKELEEETLTDVSAKKSPASEAAPKKDAQKKAAPKKAAKEEEAPAKAAAEEKPAKKAAPKKAAPEKTAPEKAAKPEAAAEKPKKAPAKKAK